MRSCLLYFFSLSTLKTPEKTYILNKMVRTLIYNRARAVRPLLYIGLRPPTGQPAITAPPPPPLAYTIFR
jgi:hypothetical protein